MSNKSYFPRDSVGRATGAPLTWSIDTTAVINLGNAADVMIGDAVVQLRANGASFSLVWRTKLHASAVADASAQTTAYMRPDVSPTTEVAAGTALTGDAICQIYCDGRDLIADVTMTSGTLLLEIVRLDG